MAKSFELGEIYAFNEENPGTELVIMPIEVNEPSSLDHSSGEGDLIVKCLVLKATGDLEWFLTAPQNKNPGPSGFYFRPEDYDKLT